MSTNLSSGVACGAVTRRRRNRWATLITTVCAFMIFSQVAIANSDIQVLTEHWPPYSYLNDDGEVAGTATEVVRQVLDTSGLNYTLTIVPWVRAYSLAQRQPNTIIYSIYRTAERESLFNWLCPIQSTTPQIIFKLTSRDDVHVTSVEDVKKYTIGVNRDAQPHQFLKSRGFIDDTDLIVSADRTHYFKVLEAGRIDLIVESEDSMAYNLRKYGLPDSYVTKLLEITRDHLCMPVSLKTDPQIFESLQRAFMTVTTSP